MTSAPSLPNLHDATLLRVQAEWAGGIAAIELERAPGVVVIVTARGLREFSMTRRHEWGPSVSVNGAEIDTSDSGEYSLTIEMQSGDKIVVRAERLDVA